MSRIVRAALTQTRSAFSAMPESTDGLASVANRLDEIRQANLDHHARLIAAAAVNGVRVIGLGELFTAPYFALSKNPQWLALAEPAENGPTVRRMSEEARLHGVVLVAPIYELDPVTGRRFNTAVIIERDGTVLGSYRKTHIPSGENERAGFHETFYYEPSDGSMQNPTTVGGSRHFPVFPTSVGRLGVAICYDRHFEGVMRSLASGGAEIVFSPAVTFGEKSRRAWEIEFATDALRHGVLIGGSNRLGGEPPWNVEYFGGSHFVGPNGRYENLAPSLGCPSELVVSDLDLAEISEVDPSGWDLSRDTRPDIYS